MDKIFKVGLEVEGGWDGEKGKRPFDIPIIADHSIDGRTVPSDNPLTCNHVGEVVSTPLEPSLDGIEAWINKYWPKYSNNTCGYHIHLSTKSVKDYCHLTTKTFLYALQHKMIAYAKAYPIPDGHYFYGRMEGRNPFSNTNFDTSNQIRMKQKQVGDRTRYGLLNFAWNIHGTMEFRALPTFEKAKTAFDFTKTYLEFVSEFLVTADRFTPSYSAQLEDAFGETRFTLITKEVK